VQSNTEKQTFQPENQAPAEAPPRPVPLTPIPENIPETLKQTPQWVCWAYDWVTDSEEPEKSKWAKVPKNAHTGGNAQSTNEKTWADFGTAWKRYANSRGKIDGIGFVVSDRDVYAAIDLDHVVENGKIIGPKAARFVEMVASYWEISPSGTGLRCFVKATLPPEGRKRGNVECYEDGRYLTVTGHRVGDVRDVVEQQAAVEQFHAEAFPARKPKTDRIEPVPLSLSDSELLEKALNSKNGGKIRALLDGDISDYGDDHSSADLALCSRLAFFSGGDPVRLDSWFRCSRLYRDKWDKRHYSNGQTYGQATIEKAISGCSNFYDPDKARKARGKATTSPKAAPMTVAPAPSATDQPDAVQEQNWRDGLLLNGVGNPKRSYANTLLFVRQYPKWAGRWSRNEMANEPYLDGARLASGVVGDLISQCERELGFSPSTEYVERAINQAADERPFHPVRDYLRSLKWDGKPRLKAAAVIFWGSKLALHLTYLRKWMISAVARAMQPGCKVDTALVLVGPQGIGKSSFWDVLGSPWFSDTEMDGGKDGLMQLHSAWIYEWGEIDRVTSVRAAEEVKGFLASREDTFRAPYARAPQTHPRSSVIVGSTNKTRFLNDSSGSRRFWIVPVTKKVPIEQLRKFRDLYWAEAVAAFDAGEQWWLTEAEDAERNTAADDHQVEDSWTEKAADWTASWTKQEDSAPEAKKRGGFKLADLLAGLGVELARQGKQEQMRASAILERLGYERKRVRVGTELPYLWTKKEGKK